MKILLILFVFINGVTVSFSQSKKEQIKQLQNQIKIQDLKIDSLTMLIHDMEAERENYLPQSPLTEWLNENFGISVPPEMVLICEFDCYNYVGKLDDLILNEFQEELWLGTFQLNEVKSTFNGFIFDLGTDDISKTMILTENYFTVSYHGMVGSDGQTLIYSFEKNVTTNDRDNFCFDIISPTVLLAGRDYYDIKDVEDPNYQGHIFENGSYNLETQQYTFITFE